MALLMGCSASEPTLEAASAGAPSFGRSLEGTSELEMLTERTEELALRYQDGSGGPVQGIQVDFVLMSGAPGASLWPSRAYTDAGGVVRTQLRAGSTATPLRVRASAPDTEPFYVDVLVRESLATSLAVQVRYDGQRPVEDYTVGAVAGLRCGDALALGEDAPFSSVVASEDGTAGLRLDVGSAAAILAWARDVTGAPVARGCVEVAAQVGDTAPTRLSVVVPVTDVPLALTEPLALPLAIDVTAAAARLREAAQSASLDPSTASTPTSDAEYYLSAVAREAQGRDGSVPSALTSDRATLAARVAKVLGEQRAGLSAVAASWAELLWVRGAQLSVAARYGREGGVALEGLTAVSSDGTLAQKLALTPALSLRTARFDEARAALSVDGLTLALGLGQYGRALTAALRDDARVAEQLAGASGCYDALAPALAGACGPETIRRACERVLGDVTSAVDGALAALDASSSALVLNGSLFVHDRTGDGRADDLGPGTLSGTWGRENVTAEADLPAFAVLR